MDNEVIEILEQGTIEGNLFKLPPIQLERKLKDWPCSYPWEWSAFEHNFYVASNGEIR